MNNPLIFSCYKNSFGIDLKEYHQSICRTRNEEAVLVEGLNKNNRLIFDDGVSPNFKLELHNNLLYLVGDRTCYLCSNVVESAYGSEFNWVRCIIMPGNIKINGETDIRKSGIVVSQFSDLISQISDESQFFNFIDKLTHTFSGCEWFKQIYSASLYVRLVSFWDYGQKITYLYEQGLLYPLEFAIYTVYKNVDVKNERILKYFIASLSESTNRILSFDEIKNIFKDLSQSEIEDILAIEYVGQNVQMDLINDEYFADILEIDGGRRYSSFVDGTYYLYYMRERANSIFKTQTFKKEYIKILKQNFRALENKIRKGKGYEGVGSYFMEKLLYNKVKTNFPHLTLHAQYSPSWLYPQRFDIYIKECDLAIEYHGAQHYLPIDFFGGIEGLEFRRNLDQRKKDRCRENSVDLFEISYEEDFEFAFENLRLHILDLLQQLHP